MREQDARRWFWHAAAGAFYLFTALVVSWHGANLKHQLLGAGGDPFCYVWFFAWFPYALQHHLDPFYTHLVWQPVGLNLGWTTLMPTLALLAYPLTVTAGAVFTYNIMMLLAPVCAALAAYALCLYVCRSPKASLLGGWVFGFSSFANAHLNAQLNLEWIALLPIIALLGLKRLHGEIGRLSFILALALALAAQAGISLEFFATVILVSAFAWALAWLGMAQMRQRLGILAFDIMLAAPVTLLLLSPMLIAMFVKPHDMSLPKLWPEFFASDPVNFFLPTSTTWLGGQLFRPVSKHFAGFLNEQASYLGLPLLFILWRYFRRSGRVFAVLFLALLVASCGPELIFGSQETGIPLPWLLMTKLPLIGNALPSRLMVYAFLLASVVMSVWLVQTTTPWRWAAGVLVILFLWPVAKPVAAVPSQAFFYPGEIEKIIGVDKRLLILPFGINSPWMYWQMESGFAFSQAGGYLGFPPKRVQNNKLLMELFFGTVGPKTIPAIVAYCFATHVDAVVVGPGTDQALISGMANLRWPAQVVDGVTIYTVPKSAAP